MSVPTDIQRVMEKVPDGSGRVLDFGGGEGELRPILEDKGYEYWNLDISPAPPGASIRGDAHQMPFKPKTFDVIVSKDSLEHFAYPTVALTEARRVLRNDGRLVVWVPFMHPFHHDDYYRFSPIGVELVMRDAGFSIVSFEAPLWVATILALPLVIALHKAGFDWLSNWVRRGAAWLDHKLRRFQSADKALAAVYLVVARPEKS